MADAPPPQVSIRNSILWGNAGMDVFSAGAAVDVAYSIAEMQVDGVGNISQDPQFVDPASGDFRLSPGSPGIDAGDPTADFDREPEPNGGRVDLGHTGNTPDARIP